MTQFEKSTASSFGKFSAFVGLLTIVLFHLGILTGKDENYALPFWMGVGFVVLGLFMIPAHEDGCD